MSEHPPVGACRSEPPRRTPLTTDQLRGRSFSCCFCRFRTVCGVHRSVGNGVSALDRTLRRVTVEASDGNPADRSGRPSLPTKQRLSTRSSSMRRSGGAPVLPAPTRPPRTGMREGRYRALVAQTGSPRDSLRDGGTASSPGAHCGHCKSSPPAQEHPPHLCPGHQRSALRPPGDDPVR